jgi:hypothetical protein
MTAQYSAERRNFLKTVVIAGGAIASLSGIKEAIATSKKPTLPLPEKPAQGYRETSHISKYYLSARN